MFIFRHKRELKFGTSLKLFCWPAEAFGISALMWGGPQSIPCLLFHVTFDARLIYWFTIFYWDVRCDRDLRRERSDYRWYFAGAGIWNQEVTGFLSRHLWAPVGATVLGFPFSSLFFSMIPTHLTRLGVLRRTPGGFQRAHFCGGLPSHSSRATRQFPYFPVRVAATTPVAR